ncbi:hypothetical protein M3Y98_00406900 [Aphelenchoides besseyi]|nr:hypothetical protein M3Y98_00406900 [Aphelenchoides besseyi]
MAHLHFFSLVFSKKQLTVVLTSLII